MKTAVSLPDDLFKRAEEAADKLGMSRSEFYAHALRSYTEHVERSTLTSRLDAAIERSGSDTEATKAVTSRGRRTLEAAGNEW